MREGVSIIFDSDGLGIYRLNEGVDAILIHRVAESTLRQMNMADLEYCLTSNVLTVMPSLQEFFADYLWTDDGETAPLLDKHAPRAMQGDKD
jgi:hypothetical protein